MPRFYANENFARPTVERLRDLEDRAVLTFNRKHFIRLHNESPDHAGIVVCTYRNEAAVSGSDEDRDSGRR